eukprot:CAMPEP_0170496500 /NCGR_PEP_ID=MMETSP0208-20121228/21816_1 /TAXON_ID=197538 /ORGANISM="Strombidium inclinatum, Strain S3" /LENGTH=49 /DNA_ID=CAMNT_0010773059 /DNA_START=301 /DNA_END=450 /DNA_ORIENTATION=-
MTSQEEQTLYDAKVLLGVCRKHKYEDDPVLYYKYLSVKGKFNEAVDKES